MSVILKAIKFNHDPFSATHDALNIRRNLTTFVNVPEWVLGTTTKPEQSVAAYAINEVGANSITIQANLARIDPSINTAQVRAIQVNQSNLPLRFFHDVVSPFFSGPAYDYQIWIHSLLWMAHASSEGNVLGEVKPTQVTFQSDGQTGFQTFELQNHRLLSAGVNISDVSWLWQYRLGPSDSWTDIVLSEHRIYTVLDTPTAPWQQLPFQPDNTQLPWTEVLDHACLWARTTMTNVSAATRVTQSLYDSGGEIVTYDCVTSGASHYTLGSPFELSFFECTAFLDLLRGGVGQGPYINCVDCATIVSTFANALGCNLSQVGIFSDLGIGVLWPLNPILAIGSSVWEAGACGSAGFVFHSVAITGFGTTNDAVFDACLAVNGNFNPSFPPFIPLLPTNLRFGSVTDGPYRNRLAAPAGSVNCQLQPAFTLKRRPVI